MSEPKLVEDRPARYRAVVLQALARLSEGDTDPATLHRARTHLRRLQAYLELVGEDRNADTIARCVVRLSKLRTLQVFTHYLKTRDAPRPDRKAVKRRLRAMRDKLDRARAYEAIERIVHKLASAPPPANPAWLADRMQAARQAHADTLRRLVARVGAKPRRKTLHRLRLLIKSIRYQEEWASDRPYAMPDLVRRLTHVQTVLGEYEDLVQFRKLARSLDLRSSPMITRNWRKARKRARALPVNLAAYLGMTAGPRIRLVSDRHGSKPAAG
jgi:CHAD domain-containing protein